MASLIRVCRVDDTDEIADLRAVVAMHRRTGMSTHSIRTTVSYTRLTALSPNEAIS